MNNRDLADPCVIQFCISVCKDVAKPNDVPRMRNFIGDRRGVAMKLIHGFATYFQHALKSRSGFVICKVLLESQTGREADC
jgi:hypothetical protein